VASGKIVASRYFATLRIVRNSTGHVPGVSVRFAAVIALLAVSPFAAQEACTVSKDLAVRVLELVSATSSRDDLAMINVATHGPARDQDTATLTTW
jgi:hypothetical protein